MTLHQAIQAHGWPFVEAWQTWRLTEAEAQQLFIGVTYFAETLSTLQQQG